MRPMKIAPKTERRDVTFMPAITMILLPRHGGTGYGPRAPVSVKFCAPVIAVVASRTLKGILTMRISRDPTQTLCR